MLPSEKPPSAAQKQAVFNASKRKAPSPSKMFDRGSPLKEQLDKVRRSLAYDEIPASASASAAASGPLDPSPSTSSAILDTLQGITEHMKLLAMKSDLEDVASKSDLEALRRTIAQDTKHQIALAVDPLKSEIHDVKTRLVICESRPAASASETSSELSKTVAKLQQAFDKVDPAHRQAAFLNWPASATSAALRLEQMEAFVKSKLPLEPPPIYGNYFGKDKKPSSSYVEFPNTIVRDNFLKIIANEEFSVDGRAVIIKKTRTKLGKERNDHMRKAEELIKASPHATGKDVTILWLQKERQVTVNGAVAFAQPPGDPRGTFNAPYLDLVLS
jgi:pyridoxine/pyridoxamine 5'-phosphate oxidase